jgi:hypothetical protein
MDRAWAANQLREFRDLIDALGYMANYLQSDYVPTDDDAVKYDEFVTQYGWSDQVAGQTHFTRPCYEEPDGGRQARAGEYTEPADGAGTAARVVRRLDWKS